MSEELITVELTETEAAALVEVTEIADNGRSWPQGTSSARNAVLGPLMRFRRERMQRALALHWSVRIDGDLAAVIDGNGRIICDGLRPEMARAIVSGGQALVMFIDVRDGLRGDVPRDLAEHMVYILDGAGI